MAKFTAVISAGDLQLQTRSPSLRQSLASLDLMEAPRAREWLASSMSRPRFKVWDSGRIQPGISINSNVRSW